MLEAYVFLSWNHFFFLVEIVEKSHKEVASVASLPGISSLAIRATRDLVKEFLFSLHYRVSACVLSVILFCVAMVGVPDVMLLLADD